MKIMQSLRKFNFTLQRAIRSDDASWSYNVANLPPAEETDSLGLVKSITVLSTPVSQKISLRFDTAPISRVTRAHPLHSFLMISFANFRLQLPSTQEGEHPKLAPSVDTSRYISMLLRTGVEINKVHYHFFGHSNAQLKSRTCFMFSASKNAIADRLEDLGDFSKLGSVSKKAKRIGLLFSAAEMAMKLSLNRVEDIDDIEHGGYNYTDGCGFISSRLCKQLVKHHDIAYRNMKYLPSVYQIRYRGYKGVVMLAPELTGKILVQFRSSMRKLKQVKDDSLGIIDYSKPYTFGYINDEIALLLHALGIATETLLKKQSDFLDFLKAVSDGDIPSTFQFLSFINHFELGEKLLLEGATSVISKEVRQLVNCEYRKMLNKRREHRCRIMIPKSRLLFGVCDPSTADDKPTRLKPGTCFVRITDHATGQARTIVNTNVLVTRNPCLHPGDLQKFRAVDMPTLSHLVDCIVFPTTGERPSADLMSGGDLDGDKFIVIWDAEIIPKKMSEPAKYPRIEEPVSISAVSGDDRADYFAKYTNASVATINNLYLKWARLEGPMSRECQQLNRLFSLGVDGNLVNVPTALQDPREPATDAPPFVLDVLHSAAKTKVGTPSESNIDILDVPIDAIDLILSQDCIAISEFDLVQLTLRWCRRNQQNFLDYACFFDFGALTDNQRKWILEESPPTQIGPDVVRNGLMQSNLVLPEELRRFGLHHHLLHWKCVFDSSTDRMERFMDGACRALGLFHKKIILLRFDKRLLIAIYVPDKVLKANETHVGSKVRVFALPQSQGPESAQYRVKATTINSRLYYDDSSFQLYDLKRSNTFIFLTRSQINSFPEGRKKRKGDKGRPREAQQDEFMNFDCRASIALDKISRDIQTHMGRVNRTGITAAEIYVISNRDVQSMAVLDEWLHYVDTNEILPLFRKSHRGYVKKDSFDVKSCDPAILHVALQVSRNNLSILQTIDSLDMIQQLLEHLETCEEFQLLRAVYNELLNLDFQGGFPVSQNDSQDSANCSGLAAILARFLQRAPYLISLFLQSRTWKFKRGALDEILTALGPVLLKELVLTANTFHYAIHCSFLLLLQTLQRLALDSFAELVELISLAVSDTELATDLLFECLEPESSRLLAGSAVEVEEAIRCFMRIALDHLDAISADKMPDMPLIEVGLAGHDEDGSQLVKVTLRIDAHRQLQIGDHVRICPSQPPQNSPHDDLHAVDALVVRSDLETTTLRCLHYLPSTVEDCLWTIRNCVSFVHARAMFSAVLRFHSQRTECCPLYSTLKGLNTDEVEIPSRAQSFIPRCALNGSQFKALEAAMNFRCTLIWGPPGTGTIRTVVTLLHQLRLHCGRLRILVAAPTHTAVDNLLRKYLSLYGTKQVATAPLRVSTCLRKVASDLLCYTCDGSMGRIIAESPLDRAEAQIRVRQARMIFTTCIDAGLGLLRSETFDVVLIDGASQLTEPEGMVSLAKGHQRAILVGDHARSRPKIRKHTVVADWDTSLFERYYDTQSTPGIAKVMLDIQYTMHPEICALTSEEFYDNRLRSAKPNSILALSKFPWPEDRRMVFVQSYAPEDLGHQSKANEGQVRLCQTAYSLLQSSAPLSRDNVRKQIFEPANIVIVTPYTRQKHALQKAILNSDVRTVDECQGHVADIVIFVSVRCNPHQDIGSLQDKQLLNTVLTGAKAGIIIIGDKLTLAGTSNNHNEGTSRATWVRVLESCAQVDLARDMLIATATK